jgi:hypothetical protein
LHVKKVFSKNIQYVNFFFGFSDSLYAQYGIPIINVGWLITVIGEWAIVPIDGYRLYSLVDINTEVGSRNETHVFID